jgi:hypothetical protein
LHGWVKMPDEEPSRRSKIVGLTVLGLVATVAIADEMAPQSVEMRRNRYADRAACERDYPPSQCQDDPGGGGSGYIGTWHGPYYTSSRANAAVDDPGPGRTGVSHVSYETSYRGGFGSIGHAMHASS